MLKLDKWGAAGLHFSAPGTTPAQRWKSTDGREIEARFVRLEGDTVLLLKAGQPLKIPLTKLAEESQELARKLGTSR